MDAEQREKSAKLVREAIDEIENALSDQFPGVDKWDATAIVVGALVLVELRSILWKLNGVIDVDTGT